ncbi:hypothetical protein SAMN05518801_10272 [Novosphingobium sp. CF614]|uniref:hypothetical protein n=1 Tax=Novosphingobium sp. CF614 TaxID=1884364 RepID=UPI0008F1CCE5|nr:hypothetical protein [Novosphingobium sp. CF614]SFF83302.1 hypothetical protein SAMN05518801_10272 [Novosphingobium sp. CF614]
MRIHDALVTLRRGSAEWERGQMALANGLTTWRADRTVAPVLAALERFGDGTALEQCPPLARLFSAESTHAMDIAGSFVAAGLPGLAAHPLGQMPLLHSNRDAAPALVLASSGRASLMLAVYDGAALEKLPAPKTAKFVPRETWIHVLAGSGTADHILLREEQGNRAILQSGRLALDPSLVLYRYGPRESLQVRRASGGLVLLRLQRQLVEQEPAREYRLPDGILLHQAAARTRDTRWELALALLGRMERKDAVARMARIAAGEAEQSVGEGARWQAVREVLALDTGAGLQLLQRLADRADDPLSGPAVALRASLLETWPELEGAAAWPG